MFMTLVGTFIASLILIDIFHRIGKNKKAWNIPGPRDYPIIGNLFVILQKDVDESIRYLISFVAKYGKIVRLWVYFQLVFVITDARILEKLLANPKYIRKSSIYDFLEVWLGKGLLISNGRKWFQRRKIITPAFHFKILEPFVEIFNEQSGIMVEKMLKWEGKGAFDINHFVTLSALDIISETALGTKINAQTNPDCEYAKAVHTMSDIVMIRILKPLLTIGIFFSIFAPKLKRRQDKALKVLHGFTENIIKERRKSLLQSQEFHTPRSIDDTGIKQKMALLDILLQSTIDGKPLSDEDIQEEVDTFTFEGHDTTTSGIAFTLFCLSRNPEVQQKVFDEICTIIGNDKTKPVTLKHLNELKYLELVIKESMRFYPPVPIIGRRLEEDFKIDDKLLPAGSNITIPIFLILKDSSYFMNPENFNPERFTSEVRAEDTNPYSYIPFSAGPRNCIGQKFAMLEMKSTISKVLRYYQLLPMGEAPKIIFNLVTRSTNGVNLGIKKREYV